MFDLTKTELRILTKLSTPIKIQNFLDRFPINWEKGGETYMSPRCTLAAKKMHCFEGALVAALALWVHGEKPLLLDLQTKDDTDHVVALYRQNGYWGAISKTNHSTLRFRDPVYKTVRELALSYFHEYTHERTGRKTLVAYSKPFNLARFGSDWVIAENDLFELVDMLDASPHYPLVPKKNKPLLRPADALERRIGTLVEWPHHHPRT